MKQRKSKNITRKGAIYLFTALFLLFFFALWYLGNSVKSFENNLTTQMAYTVQSTADYIHYRFNCVAFEADTLKSTIGPMMQETKDPYEDYQKIKNTLMLTLDQKVSSYCRIYFTRDKLYLGQFTNEWMLQPMTELESDADGNEWEYSFWKGPDTKNYGITLGKRNIVSYYCPVKSQSDLSDVDGVIVIDLNTEEIRKMLQRSGKNTIYLTDGNGRILISSSSSDAGKTLFRRKTKLQSKDEKTEKIYDGHVRYVYSSLQGTSWYLVGRIENESIFAFYRKVFLLIVFVFALLMFAVISMLLMLKNTELKCNVSEISLQAAQYQMQAMQAQIKPHFLYNTLDIIKWKILDQNTQESVKMLNDLSRFLRLSFGKGTGIVTMGQELECLGAYIKLMQGRYNNSFAYSPSVEENTLENKIPKFTLQPLVENALLHGLLNCDKKNKCIEVRSWKDENAWYIEVEDNGDGMPQEQADQILEKGNDRNSDSYGIYNIQRRLQIFTNYQCRMKVISRPNIGTCVCLEIANTERKEEK